MMVTFKRYELIGVLALTLTSVTQLASPALAMDTVEETALEPSHVWEIHADELDLSGMEPGEASNISGTNPFSPNLELPPVVFDGPVRSDFIELDLTEVPEEFHPAFENAERFYETNFSISEENQQLYAAAEFPAQIQISAGLDDLEEPIIGSAGPTFGIFNEDDNSEVVVDGASIVVTTEGEMVFDAEFIEIADELGVIESLLIHEMGHVLGFGTLWELNGLFSPGGTYPQTNIFSGEPTNALRMYVLESGDIVQQIPLENEGGEGTVNSHWDENVPVFGSNDLDAYPVMGGFLRSDPYITRISMEGFVDLGFDYNDSVLD